MCSPWAAFTAPSTVRYTHHVSHSPCIKPRSKKCVNLLGRHCSALQRAPRILGDEVRLSEALSAWRSPMEASTGSCFQQYKGEGQLEVMVKRSQAHLSRVCSVTGGSVEGGKAQLHLLCVSREETSFKGKIDFLSVSDSPYRNNLFSRERLKLAHLTALASICALLGLAPHLLPSQSY